MIDKLVRYVADGGILIGVSAGSILVIPDISTSHICGDYTGLNLVDFSFIPHHDNIPVDLDTLRKYSKEKNTVIYACGDSDGIIVNEDVIRCIGDVTLIHNRTS